LRPGTLPHHRMCGFLRTAVEHSSRLTWGLQGPREQPVVIPSMPGAPPLRLTASQAAVAFSGLTTCSIRLSYIALCGEFRSKGLPAARSPRLRRLLRLGAALPDRGGDRRCHVPPFRVTLESLCRFSLSLVLLFFGPSLGTPFVSCAPPSLLWPRLTPQGLSAPGSPRVRVCSFRSRLRALHSAISDSWASRVLACSPLASCLTAHLCSLRRTFASRPFAPAPRGDGLAVRLRLASQAPVGNLSSR